MGETASKTCPGCAEDKPLAAYSKGAGRFGLKPRCRECRARVKREYRAKNRSALNENDRRYGRTNRAPLARRDRERRAADPMKARARDAVRYALDHGSIVRPDTCSACAVACIPEGHHASYAADRRLDVVWLCRACHGQAHATFTEGSDV